MDNSQPPILGTWMRMYILILGCLAAQVLLFAFLSRLFS
jgi:hypothetical protein